MNQTIFATLVGVSLAVNQSSLKGQLLKPASFSFQDADENDGDFRSYYPYYSSPYYRESFRPSQDASRDARSGDK